MRINWKCLLTQLVIFVAIETLLGSQGLDNIADYAEFILHKQTIAMLNS